MDPKAPHSYCLLPSLPGTVPAQMSHLCGQLCLQLCWEQDRGSQAVGCIQPAVHKLLQSGARSSVGLGAGRDSDSTCQHWGWELICTKKVPFAGRCLRPVQSQLEGLWTQGKGALSFGFEEAKPARSNL